MKVKHFVEWDKLIGAALIAWLFASFVLFAWLMPTPLPHEIVRAMSVIGGFDGPPVERSMQWFGMFVACPAIIWAAYLIEKD